MTHASPFFGPRLLSARKNAEQGCIGGPLSSLRVSGLRPISHLASLPGLDQLLDAIGFECEKAAKARDIFSIIVLECPNASADFLEQIAKQVGSSLRRRDGLYRSSRDTLVALLPTVPLRAAESLGYLAKALFDSATVHVRVTAVAYPEKVQNYSDVLSLLCTLQETRTIELPLLSSKAGA